MRIVELPSRGKIDGSFWEYEEGREVGRGEGDRDIS